MSLSSPSKGRSLSAVEEVAYDAARRQPRLDALEEGSGEGSSETHQQRIVDSREECNTAGNHYSKKVNSVLDVVDAEVAAANVLNNVGNSIFFPPLPSFHARPSFKSTRSEKHVTTLEDTTEEQVVNTAPELSSSFDSTCDEALLDEHVRLLLTNKEKVKRVARAFRRYVGTLKGFLITVYALLVTFWGIAIVLFIADWMKTDSEARRRYWIEICDQVLCALFACIGLGFAPFRAVNTYQIFRITICRKSDPKQCEERQEKFQKSQTFYRYKETGTHYPFSHGLTVVIIILLDSHSILQACLGGVTWGISYHHRPTSLTATIVTFSLSCNALAGFLIWFGGHRTKKKAEIEKMLQEALREKARQKLLKKQAKQLNDSFNKY